MVAWRPEVGRGDRRACPGCRGRDAAADRAMASGMPRPSADEPRVRVGRMRDAPATAGVVRIETHATRGVRGRCGRGGGRAGHAAGGLAGTGRGGAQLCAWRRPGVMRAMATTSATRRTARCSVRPRAGAVRPRSAHAGWCLRSVTRSCRGAVFGIVQRRARRRRAICGVAMPPTLTRTGPDPAGHAVANMGGHGGGGRAGTRAARSRVSRRRPARRARRGAHAARACRRGSRSMDWRPRRSTPARSGTSSAAGSAGTCSRATRGTSRASAAATASRAAARDMAPASACGAPRSMPRAARRSRR